VPRYGDHRGIVGAELKARIVHANTLFRGGRIESRAQAPVRTHAARHNERIEPGTRDSPQAFRDECVDDRILQCESDIGAILLARVRSCAYGVQHGGFQSRKTEFKTGAIKHRPREHVSRFTTSLRKTREMRATGIWKAEQLGAFVEGLSCSVISRFTENGISPDARAFDQHGVTTRHQQSHVRIRRRIGLE
jgi:hypothetical protein